MLESAMDCDLPATKLRKKNRAELNGGRHASQVARACDQRCRGNQCTACAGAVAGLATPRSGGGAVGRQRARPAPRWPTGGGEFICVIERRLILLIGLDQAQPRDVLLMLFVGLREGVAAGAVGDEIELARARRIGGGFERGAARIGDRARAASPSMT